jgi:hypothetical protein
VPATIVTLIVFQLPPDLLAIHGDIAVIESRFLAGGDITICVGKVALAKHEHQRKVEIAVHEDASPRDLEERHNIEAVLRALYNVQGSCPVPSDERHTHPIGSASQT